MIKEKELNVTNNNLSQDRENLNISKSRSIIDKKELSRIEQDNPEDENLIKSGKNKEGLYNNTEQNLHNVDHGSNSENELKAKLEELENKLSLVNKK